MRKKHLRVLKDQILSGNLGWLARRGWNLISVPISLRLGKPLSGPIFAGMVVTYRCNETCPMCNVYKLADKDREMSTEEWMDVIDQFAELGVAGISITGGEPLVRQDILELVRHIKSHKIPVSMSTNGLLLRRKGLAEELLKAGLDSIAISIDGATAQEHDESRGQKGAFDRTMEAFDILVEAREKLGLKDKVYITLATVINAHNYVHVEDLMKLAKEKGVDNVSLNPVQDTYVFNPEDRPKELLFEDGGAEITKIPETLKRLSREYGLLDSSSGYLNTLDEFFRHKPLPVQCHAPYFSIYVDCFREILPCGGYFYECRKVMALGDKSLKEIWYSTDYQKVRDELKDCRACYYSCMSELNLNYVKYP